MGEEGKFEDSPTCEMSTGGGECCLLRFSSLSDRLSFALFFRFGKPANPYKQVSYRDRFLRDANVRGANLNNRSYLLP
jgi:hypothetical protein